MILLPEFGVSEALARPVNNSYSKAPAVHALLFQAGVVSRAPAGTADSSSQQAQRWSQARLSLLEGVTDFCCPPGAQPCREHTG